MYLKDIKPSSIIETIGKNIKPLLYKFVIFGKRTQNYLRYSSKKGVISFYFGVLFREKFEIKTN